MRAQLVAAGVGDQDLHQEAVELGFRQRISAFHLDGILGGHHQERPLQFVGGGAAGDGALLHGFEQRRLRLGGGAVDLVGQHQVGEDRARLEAQRLFRRRSSVSMIMLPTMSAGIRSGVNWMREYLSCRAARQGAQQCGLAEAGDALQQHMAAGEQADQHAFHHVVLPYDDFGDFAADGIRAGSTACWRVASDPTFYIVEHGYRRRSGRGEFFRADDYAWLRKPACSPIFCARIPSTVAISASARRACWGAIVRVTR